MVLMRGIGIETLYKMLGKTDSSSYNQVVNPKTDDILSCVADSSMLWNQRLRHISEKGLCAMHRKGTVKGLPDCSSKFYFVNIVFMVNKTV